MTSPVSNTAFGIVSDALVETGKLAEGQVPSSEQLSKGLRRLNDIINVWQTQGLKLFLQQEVNVPLVVGQTQYVLGPSGPAVVMSKPRRILQGFIVNTSNVRRPLVLISRDEWERLSQVVGNNGAINSFMVDKQTSVINLNLWPPPDSTEVLNTATFLVDVQAPGPINLTDSMAFPQEWRLALVWALADELATGQPQAIIDRCALKAQAYREALEDWDVEDASTYFNIDMRVYQNTGRFR